jgi:wyosine [tRNA(Phe)-imidazoG37] synthetase (radical SAM superfamily)
MAYPIKLDTILIELADFCNLSCIMCDLSEAGRRRHGHNNPEKPFHTTRGKFLPFSAFKKLINSVEASGIQVGILSLFWLGEPMINPEIGRMLEYLETNAKSIGGWLLHTNGQVLTDSTARLLVQKGCFKMLHFSIDAASQEVYSKVRRGGNYALLVKNVRKVLDLVKASPNENFRLILQFIVMEENKQDAESFVVFWKHELESRGLECTVAGSYSQHKKHTIFLRQEIAKTQLQAKADALHREVCKSLCI